MNRCFLFFFVGVIKVMTEKLRLIVSFNRREGIEIITINSEFDYSEVRKTLADSLNIHEKTFTFEYFDNVNSTYIPINERNIKLIKRNSRILIIENSSESNTCDVPLIQGRLFPNINELIINSNLVKIAEIENASLGTGLITWDSSVVLAKYLEHNPAIVQNKHILELGAGTGVCGISAAYLGASYVVLTDLAYVIKNLQKNVEINFPQHPQTDDTSTRHVHTQLLEWGNQSTYIFPNRSNIGFSLSQELQQNNKKNEEQEQSNGWDVILGADIVWLENLVPLLIHALTLLTSKSTVFILSYQKRSERTDILFFNALKTLFIVEKVNRDNFPSEFRDQNKIEVYHCYRSLK